VNRRSTNRGVSRKTCISCILPTLLRYPSPALRAGWRSPGLLDLDAGALAVEATRVVVDLAPDPLAAGPKPTEIAPTKRFFAASK
jgi:hypothetical protein